MKTIITREGDASKRSKSNNDVNDFGILKAEYRACKKKYDDADETNENEKSKMQRVSEELNRVTEQLDIAQEEIDSTPLPEGAQPRERIQKRDKLLLHVAQLQMAYESQHRTTSAATDVLRQVEFELFSIDKKMSNHVDNLKDADESFKIQAELDQERAQRLVKLEKKKAKAWEKTQKAAIENRAVEVEAVASRSKDLIAVAKKGQKTANRTLQLANQKTKEVVAKIEKSKIAHELERAEKVLELKANINFVEDEVKTAAAKNRKKAEDDRLELEREKESMLAKGLNPYVEFRRRDFERADRRLEKSLKDAVAQNKITLSERLLKEADIARREEAIAKKEREYEKEHRDSQGGAMNQQKNQAYIKEVTTAHVELLDPAGRAARVDPSQITDIADYSYGLGKSSRIPSNSMKRITEKIRNSLNVDVEDFGEYQRLLTSLQKSTGAKSIHDYNMNRTQSAPNREMGESAGGETNTVSSSAASAEKKARLAELTHLAKPTGDLPGTKGAATTLNFADEEENPELLRLVNEELGEVGVDDSIDGSEFESKYPPVIQSKFEQDAFERAKGRQRQFLDQGTVQIAGGWEFKGNSFMSKPSEIVFKDFVVGKVYKKRFTLTNVSYTFNNFKLLDLNDDVVDFFEISYDKPGRMSAGVSCFIDIVFSPKMNHDIFSYIPLSTATGPIRIPLTCLIQRCAPRVRTEAIDFGQIVIGEKAYKSVKIVNTQAIPTSFSVRRIPPVVPKTEEELAAEAIEAQRQAEIAARLAVIQEKVDASVEGLRIATENLETANGGKDKKAKAAAETEHGSATLAKEEADKEMNDFREEQRAEEEAAAAAAKANCGGQEDDDVDIEIGNSPAVNDAELASRVRNVVTSSLRRKKKENPNVFSVVSHKSLVDLSAHRVGLQVCDISPLGENVPSTSVLESFQINGYSECIVAFLCSPLTVEAFEESFDFCFEAVPKPRHWDPANEPTVDAEGKVITRVQRVKINSEGIDLPIYLGQELIDLKCTLHDRIYRKRIEIRNRAKTAYRINFVIPPKFAHYIDVNPPMLFVQGGMSQEVNLRFTPMRDMVKKVGHFTRLYEDFDFSALFTYPLMMTVVNQSLPIFCTIKTDFNPSALKFSTTSLDFSKVYVFQRTSIPITVTNTSMLPQKVAAVRLKKEISVEPNAGFLVLLPNETVTINVSFSPFSALTYNLDLVFQTSMNDTYTIKVKGLGIEPPVELSAAVLHMRSTFSGERVLENVFIKNTTEKAQNIELLPPSPQFSWLKFSPTVLALQPGEVQRVEVDFNPPPKLLDTTASDWYSQLTRGPQTDETTDAANDEGKEGAGKLAEDSPFESFEDEGKWTYGRGMYGTIQWANQLWKTNVDSQTSGAVEGVAASGEETGEGEREGDAENTDPNSNESNNINNNNNDENKSAPTIQEANSAMQAKLDPHDWGIVGTWNIPILIEKAQSKSATTVAREDSVLFISIQTTVNLPELDVETTDIDFGQSAVGVRMTKMIKVRNRTDRSIHLQQAQMLNALGPFSVLNFVREIRPGEITPILFNCVPTTPALSIEQLVLASPDLVGHQLRFTLKVQGVNPTVSITGLEKAIGDWGGALGGIVDFGNVVAGDVVTKTITVTNKSDFAIHMQITRVLCDDLSPFLQAKIIQRTASGLPIYAYRPEDCRIESGVSKEVEFTFRPDRGREMPFREDINISVGQSDGLIKVCLAGRAVDRQLLIAPNDPLDEPFFKNNKEDANTDGEGARGAAEDPNQTTYLNQEDNKTEQPSGVLSNQTIQSAVSNLLVEDIQGGHLSQEVRNISNESRSLSGLSTELRAPSKIKLEYPDPFAEDGSVDESSYVEVEAGGGGKAPAKGAPAAAAVTTRRQSRKLNVCCAKISDGRNGSTTGGTYEVVLSPEAVASGLFQVLADKGNVAVGAEVVVEIQCSLPTPRGIGGLQVGSWQTYEADVILKGGWKKEGTPDDFKVPFLLSAYLRL